MCSGSKHTSQVPYHLHTPCNLPRFTQQLCISLHFASQQPSLTCRLTRFPYLQCLQCTIVLNHTVTVITVVISCCEAGSVWRTYQRAGRQAGCRCAWPPPQSGTAEPPALPPCLPLPSSNLLLLLHLQSATPHLLAVTIFWCDVAFGQHARLLQPARQVARSSSTEKSVLHLNGYNRTGTHSHKVVL